MLCASTTHRPLTLCRQRRHCAPNVVAALVVTMLALSGGCSRSYYHRQADREVSRIITQKNAPGQWGLPGFRLQYDPRSRYFDPTNPDRPPMPPDDPYSHAFMHRVDRKHGALTYHIDGDLTELPNPSWREQLAFYTDMKPDGTVHLTLDGAVQLGIIQSPAYFQQLEELYLSALDVSTERWRFDAQFFGSIDSFFTHRAKNAPAGGPADNLNDVNTLQMQKQFAAGGELVVGLANTIVWQFAGQNSNANVSLLNFSFLQPLLRGGGRRFILEQLTIVERAMLANLRAFERYRQGFYTNVAIGDGGTTGPSRRGGFFGGTGLTGFSGQGSGGFGEVGGATGFGGRANNNAGSGGGGGSGFAGGGAGTVGGFVGILQQQQQILNSRQNLQAQTRRLKLLETYLDAGAIDIAQVDQFRQNVATARAGLLQSEINVINTMETFKRTTLGLPPDLPMSLDDSMILQFQLIVPTTNDLNERIEDLIDNLGEQPQQPGIGLLTAAVDEFDALLADAERMLALVAEDLKTARGKNSERKQGLTTKERAAYDVKFQKIIDDLAKLNERFPDVEKEAARLRADLPTREQGKTLQDLVTAARLLSEFVQEASLVQVRARLEAVTLNPVRLDPHVALEIARANRYDWMNNRAALVDTWRLIAFNARALMSNLNLVLEGNINTRRDNPVNFAGATGAMRAGFEFDAPFTRLLERNNYRSVLIDYQRDRRQLIQYEDGVNQTLRQSLRTLAYLEQNLEIQRAAVEIAARRVDQTRETLSEPPEPTVAGQAAAPQFGPTAALNLLTAMNDLLSSQNNFMSVWLNHYAARMVLMRELGLMELDENGLWIDRPMDEVVGTAERMGAEALPPDVPLEWFEALGVEPPAPPDRSLGPVLPDDPNPDDLGSQLPVPGEKSNRRNK